MSQANVDVVKRAYERMNARMEVPQELFDPGWEFDTTDIPGDWGVLCGSEAVNEAMRDYAETFDDFHVELGEVLHVGTERVVNVVHDEGRMRGSDARVGGRRFHVWTFRDGKVVRLSVHTDRSRALEAAGLRE